MELSQFIETKLNRYAERIVESGEQLDEYAFGEMSWYLALRRILAGKGTPQDLGMMDAINDTLQEKGIIGKGTTFLNRN